MRRVEKPQLQVIEHEDGKTFQILFNDAMKALAEYDPEFIFKDFPGKHCAYITWIVKETIIETYEDEFLAKGQKRHCKDCPYFDANEDGRIVTGQCCVHDKLVRKDRSACEIFYKRWKEGVI